MVYKVGDFAVHPHGGLVRVIGKEERTVDGVASILIHTHSVYRPGDRFKSPPKLLRAPMGQAEAEELLEALENKPARKRGRNPAAINTDRVKKSQSSDPRVVLDLIWELRPVGNTERRQTMENIFQAALFTLASELSHALNCNLEKAKKLIKERMAELEEK